MYVGYCIPGCVQPVAMESRYVCRVHQHHQAAKLGGYASARGNRHHGNDRLTSLDRHLPRDVDSQTASGRRVMTSSIGQPDSDEETTVEDHLMKDDGKTVVDEEPVWIVRSPSNSTYGDPCRRHRRRSPEVNPTFRQLAAEVLQPDDDVIRRRRRRNSKEKL